MPKDFESNWDDLARQLGFEPEEEPQEPVSDSEIESSFSDSGTESAELPEVSPNDHPDSPIQQPGSDVFDSGPAEIHGDQQNNDVLEEMFDSSTDSSPAVPAGEEFQGQAVEPPAGAENVSDSEGIETIEFAVEDLTDSDDDRPRRRRKTRRRRRAAIEELREELEREKELESIEESPEPIAAEEDRTLEPEPEPEADSGRRRRRRRSRSDSTERGRSRNSDTSRTRDANEVASEVESDDFSDERDSEGQEKVSKNRRRRRKRERSEEISTNGAERTRRQDESKPERRFPTWEEAIMPLIEANMERTEKPQRRRRQRRGRDS